MTGMEAKRDQCMVGRETIPTRMTVIVATKNDTIQRKRNENTGERTGAMIRMIVIGITNAGAKKSDPTDDATTLMKAMILEGKGKNTNDTTIDQKETMNGDDIDRETSGHVNETKTTNTGEERAIVMRKCELAQKIEDYGGGTNQMTTRTAGIASTTAGIETEMTTSITVPEGTRIALGKMEAKN